MYGFTLLMKNYVNMKVSLVKNIKTSTNWFNPERGDNIPQTGTDLEKSRQLECLQKQVITNMTGTMQSIWIFCIKTEHKNSYNTFLDILQKLDKLPFLGALDKSALIKNR